MYLYQSRGKSKAVWKVNFEQGLAGILREPQQYGREGSFKEIVHWKEKIITVEKISSLDFEGYYFEFILND